MKAIINVKTETAVKRDAQRVAGELGLSLSAVINAYLRQFVRNREVAFSLTSRMSPELETLLGSVETDIQRKRNMSKTMSSAADLKKHLSSL